MPDIRIRRNEHCVIGLPACDYVFSSTRSCFIAYGFSTSALERDILKSILAERGVEAIEASENLDPGKFAFCTKICSKIITSQFCIVLINNDSRGRQEVANANVNMEYGLMLGHNKYVIPFQREEQKLPFNVSGLDTIKYNQGNFRAKAIAAVDQAIHDTSQTQAAPNFDQIVNMFLLIKNTTLVNVDNDSGERAVYHLGAAFGFNLLVKFDGLSYVFLGNFGALRGSMVVWRVTKLLEMLLARMGAVSTRVALGLTDEQGTNVLAQFIQRLEIWLILAGQREKEEVGNWLGSFSSLPFKIDTFTMDQITEVVSQLPS